MARNERMRDIRRYANSAGAEPTLMDASELPILTALPEDKRKLIALVFQNKKPDIAKALNCANDNAMHNALQALKKELKGVFSSSGVDFATFQSALKDLSNNRRLQLADELQLADDGNDRRTTGGDMNLVLINGCVELLHNFALALAAARALASEREVIALPANSNRRLYKNKQQNKQRDKKRWESISASNDKRKQKVMQRMLLRDLIRNDISVEEKEDAVVVLGAYLECHFRDKSIESNKMKTAALSALERISFPSFLGLGSPEKYENYLETKARNRYLQIENEIVPKDQKRKKKSELSRARSKYERLRSRSLLSYAQRYLDSNNELGKKLMEQIKGHVKEIDEKHKSRLAKIYDNKKKHRSKKLKLYAGGRMTLDELMYDARDLFHQKMWS